MSRLAVRGPPHTVPAPVAAQPLLRSSSLRDLLHTRTRALRIGLTPYTPPCRPNTVVKFEFFDPLDVPAAPSPLRPDVWGQFLRAYPDGGVFSGLLLGAIRHGAKLAYEGAMRMPRVEVRNLPMSPEERASVDAEIKARFANGGLVALRAPDVPSNFVASPLGAVEKAGAGPKKKFRTIHNLSHPRNGSDPARASLNSGIDKETVTIQYESIDGLFRQIRAAHEAGLSASLGLWKIDLKDAYRHIVLAKSIAPMLGFKWEGILYHDTVLSFGGRSAPFVFNLFGEGAQWILQSLGIDCYRYLDDFFGLTTGRGQSLGVGSPVPADELVPFATSVLEQLGFSVSPQKVVHGPVVEILGITVDAPQAIAWVTSARRDKLKRAIAAVLGNKTATTVQLQSIAGTLLFVSRVCPLGRAFIRRIFDEIAERDKKHRQPLWKGRVHSACCSELQWWTKTLEVWPGRRLLVKRRVIELWTDASGSMGIGGALGSVSSPLATFSLRIPDRHANKDILFKEAYAVLHAVDSWSETHLRGCELLCHIDNQALVAALKSGRCRSPNAQALVRRIFTVLAAADCDLVPSWLPSANNKLADALSRVSLTDMSVLVAPEYLDTAVLGSSPTLLPTAVDPDLPADGELESLHDSFWGLADR